MDCVNFVPDKVKSESWRMLCEPQGIYDDLQDGFDDTLPLPPTAPSEPCSRSDDDGKLPDFTPGTFVSCYISAYDGVPREVLDCDCGRSGVVTSPDLESCCLAGASYVDLKDCRAFNRNTLHSKPVIPSELFFHPSQNVAPYVVVREVSADDKIRLEVIHQRCYNLDARAIRLRLKNVHSDTCCLFFCKETFLWFCGENYFRFCEGKSYLCFGANDDVSVEHKSSSIIPLLASSIVTLASVAIVAYASFELSKTLVAAAKKACSYVGAFFTIGDKTFSYDADNDVYEAVPQGPQIITRGGRRFVMVRQRTGAFRLYPEESWVAQIPDDNCFIKKFSENKRFNDQFPLITSNLWAAVRSDGKLMGTVLALNETSAMCPLHVALSIANKGCSLKKDNIVLPVTPNIDTESSYVIEAVGEDLACIHFLNERFPKFRLPSARDMFKKFSCVVGPVPATCRSVFCCRVADGSLQVDDCSISLASDSTDYVHGGREFSVPKNSCRTSSFNGFSGACGGVYLHNGESNTDMILGVHVAFLPISKVSVLHTVDSHHISRMKMLYPGTSHVSEDASPSLGISSLFGVASARTSTPVAFPSKGKRGVTLFDDQTDCKYMMAHLQPFEKDGAVVHPVAVTLNAIEEKAHAPRAVGRCLTKAINHLVRVYKLMRDPDRKLLPFCEVVSADSGLPHIDLDAASGHPFNQIDSGKRVFFDIKKNLLPEADEFLQYFELQLVPTSWVTIDFADLPEVDAICTGCNKDEPRPVEKAQAGKTRLFAVCPLQEFILQRKYFLEFAKLLTDCNLATYSALGLSPSDYGHSYE